jgi:5-methylcytosine-specific restriction endonuclease McrA
MTHRRRHSLLYVIYLRSPLWRLRRRLWIIQAGGRCQRCGSRRRLTIHHRSYRRLGHEHSSDVAVLCWYCHRREHHAIPRRDQLTHGLRRIQIGLLRLAVAAVMASMFVELATHR